MSQPLQRFDNDGYERPNQPWGCGHVGQSCPLGPTAAGICQAGTGCRPLGKEGNVTCGRSALQGGKCDEGPNADGACGHVLPHCTPRASIRLQRSRFVRFCVATTCVGLLVVLVTPWRNEFLAPGPLTRPHAQLLLPQNEHRCLACHGAAASHLGGWTLSLISPGSIGGSQSDRCLACHEKQMPAATALHPHGLHPVVLEELTRSCCERTGQNARRESRDNEHAMACAACHREHQGANHDMTSMTNSQCATCHQQQFTTLAEHPPFQDWPYQRRMRIAFDHASHMAKHFPQQSTAFACKDCHLGSTATDVVSITGYATCSRCHDEKLQQSFGDGLALFALPLIDTQVLAKYHVDIGEWPAAATGDFDGSLPPLTRTLLVADSFAKSALEQFGADFEFLDVQPNNIDDLEAVADILWGFKYLLYDLIESGTSAWQSRLAVALHRPVDETLAQQLTGELPRETLRELQRAWFPNLMSEVVAHRAGRQLPPPTQRPDVSSPSGQVNGWTRDDQQFTFSYRPAGHASPMVTNWINTLASSVSNTSDVQSLHELVISQTSMGLCTTCHSMDADSADPARTFVNWRAHQPNDRRGFTKFAHDPHLLLPQLADCTGCHELNREADIAATYQSTDLQQFVSNFHSLSTTSCLPCHQPQAAGDQCTTCHNYHVE